MLKLVGRFREVESNEYFVRVPVETLLLDFFSSWTIVLFDNWAVYGMMKKEEKGGVILWR